MSQNVQCVWCGRTYPYIRGAKHKCPESMKPDPRQARIAFLERKRLVTIEDAKVKLEAEDWHGVCDAAMDLRDCDNELDGLRF